MRLGLITAFIAISILAVAAAEPPCRPRQVFQHTINAATIFHQSHLQIVEVPVPAFIFQTLSAYQTPVQDSSVALNSGIGTNEMLQRLLDTASNASNSLPIDEIRQKCTQCHGNATAAKAGLKLFNEAGEYAPTSPNKSLTRQMIAARARSTGNDVMPPAARLDSNRRLSETAAAFLER